MQCSLSVCCRAVSVRTPNGAALRKFSSALYRTVALVPKRSTPFSLTFARDSNVTSRGEGCKKRTKGQGARDGA